MSTIKPPDDMGERTAVDVEDQSRDEFDDEFEDTLRDELIRAGLIDGI